MQVGSGTESIRVPGRVIDLGMWLVLLGKEESPSAPSARGDEIWRARMRLALRVQGWCEDVAMTALIEATRLRLAAWAATVARVRSLAELQETTSELERGWAYIFDILGSTTPVWHKAGYRLDEVVLWNAFADVLVAILPLAIGPVGDVGQGAMLADQRARTLSASYPLSAITVVPGSSPSSRAAAQVMSWSLPGEIRRRTGRPLPSTRAWILVVSPPRLRPTQRTPLFF